MNTPAAAPAASLNLPRPDHAAWREDDVGMVGVPDARPHSKCPPVLGPAVLRPLRVEVVDCLAEDAQLRTL
eukprot:3011529-Alexandrium_andersonii.AAC.1